jgi:hypothetical protein
MTNAETQRTQRGVAEAISRNRMEVGQIGVLDRVVIGNAGQRVRVNQNGTGRAGRC